MKVEVFTVVVGDGATGPAAIGVAPPIGAMGLVTKGVVNVLVVKLGANLPVTVGAGSVTVMVRKPVVEPSALLDTTGENKVGETELTSTGATLMAPTKLTWRGASGSTAVPLPMLPVPISRRL